MTLVVPWHGKAGRDEEHGWRRKPGVLQGEKFNFVHGVRAPERSAGCCLILFPRGQGTPPKSRRRRFERMGQPKTGGLDHDLATIQAPSVTLVTDCGGCASIDVTGRKGPACGRRTPSLMERGAELRHCLFQGMAGTTADRGARKCMVVLRVAVGTAVHFFQAVFSEVERRHQRAILVGAGAVPKGRRGAPISSKNGTTD